MPLGLIIVTVRWRSHGARHIDGLDAAERTGGIHQVQGTTPHLRDLVLRWYIYGRADRLTHDGGNGTEVVLGDEQSDVCEPAVNKAGIVEVDHLGPMIVVSALLLDHISLGCAADLDPGVPEIARRIANEPRTRGPCRHLLRTGRRARALLLEKGARTAIPYVANEMAVASSDVHRMHRSALRWKSSQVQLPVVYTRLPARVSAEAGYLAALAACPGQRSSCGVTSGRGITAGPA
jgi:hypothetical protein